MKISAQMVCMSHLSDVQEENSFKMTTEAGEADRVERIRHRVNFVKYIMMKLDGNLNQDIDPNKMYTEFTKAYPKS